MTPWGALLAVSSLASTVRMGLFVGSDTGLGDEPPLVYAEGEARELARVFQEMGGFARDRITVLQGPTPSAVRDAMRAVEAEIHEVSAAGDGTLLVFYYSGHASREGLHLSGSVLPMDEVRQWLERSAAQIRVAFVDACEAGALARGGTPAEVIEVQVDDTLTASGLAIIASTGPMAVARESSLFGGGVFTRALLGALRGGADTDGDGIITLDEAYRYAFESTVVGTARSHSGVQRPEYRYALTGVGQVPLTRVESRAAAVVLPEEAEGVYAVISVASGQIVARIDKQPGELRRIALPTGRYVVRKLRQSDVLVGEIDLVWGGDRWVQDSELDAVALGDPLARGGSRKRSSAAGLVLGGPAFIRGNPAQWGAALEGRLALSQRLRLIGGLAATTGRRSEQAGEVHTQQGRLSLGLAALQRLRHLDLSISAGGAVLGVSQRLRWLAPEPGGGLGEQLERRTQLVPALWAGGELSVPLGPVVALEAGARSHLVRAIVNAEPGFHVLVEGRTGLSLRF